MIKYLIFDLDGTIATKFNRIHKKVISAIIRARKKGFKIAIATGRHINSVLKIAELIKCDIYSEYIICLNGGSIWKYNDSGIEKIYQETIHLEMAKNLFDLAKSLNISISGYSTNGYIYTNNIKGVKQKFLSKRTKMETKIVDKNFNFEIFKFIAWGTNKKIDLLINECKKMQLEIYKFSYVPGTKNIEICPQNVNKVSAIKKICQIENLNNYEVAYFGDGDNDIKALEWVGHSVSMLNGSKEAKKTASFITRKSNKKGGVGFYIEENLLRE
ncbi:HAD family hydrolase [Spiroplasma endosymbiont of Aspidapion aeneum]|uniref:HAD family hydrolase n=1 Tax=Spiroplasma endosymbiont of Aspidapion aeneum TaxID=3066276 RepID=UPI00313BCF76